MFSFILKLIPNNTLIFFDTFDISEKNKVFTKNRKFLITFSLWTLVSNVLAEYIRYRSHKYTLALYDKLGLFALPSEGSPQKKACPRSFSKFECLKRSKLVKTIRWVA